jgi:hypothetical protein
MQKRQRFHDSRCEIVWAAVTALDVGEQRELLALLASLFDRAAADPRTDKDKVRLGVHALREVADVLGHSPSIAAYEEVRQTLPELRLPPNGSVRRWLGGSWNACLRRALLEAVSDGDFAARAIGLNDRFEDEETFEALRQCVNELGFAPSITAYFGWARRPDVRERQGRRPLSYKPFERFGGIRSALVAAGVLGENEARHAVNGRLLPLRYAYSEQDICSALQLIAKRLGRSPRASEYEKERQRARAEWRASGETEPLPTVDVIRKRYGYWNAALEKAGLTPLAHQNLPHLGTRRPVYTDEEKLDWIRRAWMKVGEPFTGYAYKHWRKEALVETGEAIPCLPVIERTFGGWKRARELALPGQAPQQRGVR